MTHANLLGTVSQLFLSLQSLIALAITATNLLRASDLLSTLLAPFAGCGVHLSCGVLPQLIAALVEVFNVLTAPRCTTDSSGLFGRSLPNHLSDFLSHLFDGIHGPDDIQMLVDLNDLRMDNVDEWFTIALKTTKKTATVNKVICTTDPERKRWRMWTVPCETRAAAVSSA